MRSVQTKIIIVISAIILCENGKSGKPIPVIFLTADDNKETRDRALFLGAADLIPKPFDTDTLVRKTKNILSGVNGSLTI